MINSFVIIIVQVGNCIYTNVVPFSIQDSKLSDERIWFSKVRTVQSKLKVAAMNKEDQNQRKCSVNFVFIIEQ